VAFNQLGVSGYLKTNIMLMVLFKDTRSKGFTEEIYAFEEIVFMI